jgi:hypothetical protein
MLKKIESAPLVFLGPPSLPLVLDWFLGALCPSLPPPHLLMEISNGKRFEIDNEKHQASTTQYKKLTLKKKNLKKVWKMYIT